MIASGGKRADETILDMISSQSLHVAPAFAISLHGEQLIPIFIGAVVLGVALLAGISWLLVRYFRPRIGRKALALAAVPFLLAAIALLLEYERERPNAGPPRAISSEKLPGLIKRLPANARFSYSGLSFFDGRLYVGTNLGVIEFSGTKATQLYQFQSSDSVVSGPWTDIANHRLWAVDDHTQELINFDVSNILLTSTACHPLASWVQPAAPSRIHSRVLASLRVLTRKRSGAATVSSVFCLFGAASDR